MAKVTKYICDIMNCGRETTNNLSIDWPVVVTGSRDDGSFCMPYIEMEALDLCDKHKEELIKLLPLKSSGAQGHHLYWITEKE